MTLDGSLQRWSVTCRYHSMPSPTLGPYIQCMCVCVCVWISIQWGGKEPPSRFWFYCRHASPLALEWGPAPSFLSFSPRYSPLFYIPSSSSSFLPSRTVLNGSSRTDFGGDASLRQNSKGDDGDSVRLRRAALCHFFIHPWFCGRLAWRIYENRDPPSIRIARFPPFSSCRSCFKFLRAAHPFAQVLSSYRENMRSFVRNWRDDYARSRHAKSSFTVLWWHVY